MELYDHIRKISFVFFLVTGLAHFLAGLLFINGYFAPQSGLINRVLFIPFVLATLSYGLSNLKCHLIEIGKTSKSWDYAFLTVGLLVFLGMLAIELFVADSPCPLSPLPCSL